MKKESRLNAFAMNCVAHQSPGLWTHLERGREPPPQRAPVPYQAGTSPRGRQSCSQLAPVAMSAAKREPILHAEIRHHAAVERKTGGKNGGGAVLTPFGLSLVARYRRIERDAASAVKKELAALRSDIGRPVKVASR